MGSIPPRCILLYTSYLIKSISRFSPLRCLPHIWQLLINESLRLTTRIGKYVFHIHKYVLHVDHKFVLHVLYYHYSMKNRILLRNFIVSLDWKELPKYETLQIPLKRHVQQLLHIDGNVFYFFWAPMFMMYIFYRYRIIY